MTITQGIKSLALSVHFHQPKLGMKRYEILSRASAFLLAVDPKETLSESTDISPYDHLKQFEEQQKIKEHKRDYARQPAGGPSRAVEKLGWLEFCPAEHRPVAHVIASSHVLAPWMWKDYYPQDWIQHVSLDNCAYSLDVICSSQPDKSIAKFALNPYPIHHPENIDLSIIHLKNETAALNHMKDLGVEMLYLRDIEKEFIKSETLYFDGFEITDDNVVDDNEIQFQSKNSSKDDTRSFKSYKAKGELLLFSPSRFLASTPDTSNTNEILNKPLPQGLCGGPVLDNENHVCGVVEGVVPMDHSDKNIAGAAAFIPLHVLKSFVDSAECFILEQIVPNDLFGRIKDMKEGNEIDFNQTVSSNQSNTGNMEISSFHSSSSSQNSNEENIEDDLENIKNDLKKQISQEELDTILSVVQDEKDQVLDILKTEGGDLDQIIAKVRTRTLQNQLDILRKYKQDQGDTIVVEDIDETNTKEK